MASFSAFWRTLLDELYELPEEATLITPLSNTRFRISDVQEKRVVIKLLESDMDEIRPLHPDEFKKLYQRVADGLDEFNLDRLPPNAEQYATVLSIHSRIKVEEHALVLIEAEAKSRSPFVEYSTNKATEDRWEDQMDSDIKEMMDNMGDPRGRVDCPIEVCDYSHRSAASVARHVSGSSTSKHIWENTEYAGWRDFVRKHGESPG